MIKFYKKYESGCSKIEIITIENNILTDEFLFTDNKAVWKTWKADIIKDNKWNNVKDYIQWIKELGFKELREYKDNLVWTNTVTNKPYKQYEFNM